MQKDIKHFASPSFWTCYEKLPADVQKLADKNFDVLKTNPKHPSLHFKKVGKYCSVRVGMKYHHDGIDNLTTSSIHQFNCRRMVALW